MTEVRIADHWFTCEITPAGRLDVVDVDQALADRLAEEKASLLGDAAWMSLIPLRDLRLCLDAVDRLADGRKARGRVRVRARGDETLVFELTARPTTAADGGPVRVQVQARDVTKLARLESLLEARNTQIKLLESQLRIAVWTTDEALRLTRWSGSAPGDPGIRENPLGGPTLFELFETEDPDAPAIAAHHRALQGESTSYEVEWGGGRWRCLLEPLVDEAGRISTVVGVAIDLAAFMDEFMTPPQQSTDGSHLAPAGLGDEDEEVSIGPFVIDPGSFEVYKDGEKLVLTLTEFKLLMEFAAHPGKVVSRQVLAERVWGHEFFGNTSSVSMAISRLREKIEDDPAAPTVIETVRGVGYRFNVDPSSDQVHRGAKD
jgi:DNA-binding winged helix-turn-helix (wHTH) protein/PAS domain-containing protein